MVADVEVIKLSHAGGIATFDDELFSVAFLASAGQILPLTADGVTSARSMVPSTLIGGGRDVAAKASGNNDPDRTPDRFAAGLAVAFIVLLLATELVLTLPDEADSPAFVAQFYTEHRAFIIALQMLGVVDALLLGGYAWRLRSVDRFVAGAGLLLAFCALAPAMITVVLAIVAER